MPARRTRVLHDQRCKRESTHRHDIKLSAAEVPAIEAYQHGRVWSRSVDGIHDTRAQDRLARREAAQSDLHRADAHPAPQPGPRCSVAPLRFAPSARALGAIAAAWSVGGNHSQRVQASEERLSEGQRIQRSRLRQRRSHLGPRPAKAAITRVATSQPSSRPVSPRLESSAMLGARRA